VFTRYFGAIHPAVAIAAITVAGIVSLAILRARARIVVFERPVTRGMAKAVLVGLSFALPTVVVDCIAPFPATINVPMPAALWFYPLIGAVAEVVFHIVPLAIIAVVVPRTGALRSGVARWCAVAIVAAVEPAFQIVAARGDVHAWVLVYMGVQLFALGVAQLHLLWTRGVAAMVGARLGYYLVWHLVWGTLRLALLF